MLDFVSHGALHVVAAARQAAHGAQRKAALVVAIHNRVRRHGRHIGQHAQPAKRVNAFKFLDGIFGHTGTARAMKAVAASDKVAGQLLLLAVLNVAHFGLGAVKVMNADLARFIHSGQPGGRPRIHQVAGDFSLTISRHHLAAGQVCHSNAVALVFKHQLNRVVWCAFSRQALTSADLMQHIDGTLFQNARTDAAQNVVAALTLNDDVVYAGLVQQSAEQ